MSAASARRKSLSECLREDVAEVSIAADRDVWITGLATDSRRVRPGDLFIATRGAAHDGHDFVEAAVAKGAVAVLAERDVKAPVLVVKARDTRRAAGRIAARFFDHPSRTLGCIGVTGTNGKTSVTQFAATLLYAAGKPAGFGGTLGWSFGGKHCAADLTTEDAVTVQRRLADLVSAGAEWVAMETSSHALDQDRVADVAYDVAVFTNLTRDHLDYHGTMERYATAKRRLFDWPTLQGGAVNWDDPQGRIIYRDRSSAMNLLRFGSTPDADLAWSDLTFTDTGVAGTLTTPWGRREFHLPLFGEFNVANFAAATAAACLAGASFDDVIGASSQLAAPPGRMQFVRSPGQPLVMIDFAHTPDALTKVLSGVKRHVAGRIVCVFGCGGDRDRGKRPLMARAAEAGADRVFVTSDNPRSEDPAAIAAEIASGFQGRVAVEVDLDRGVAIRNAIASAAQGDVVVVAGKGHETYQEIAGVRHPFSDLQVVQQIFAAQSGTRG